MQAIINTILKYIKWPLALLMVLMFLPTLQADMILVKATFNQDFLVRFILPMLGMFVLWFSIPGLNGSHFAIFEHEFTHMFAAILTFHRPKSMRIESDKGGSFGYYGEGNWFITLAPYFVPTIPILIIISGLIVEAFNKPVPSLYVPALGAMFGYHLVSNAAQIHTEQTDFAKAGWVFSLLFLPTANLLAFGFIWAFAARNFVGVSKWGALLWRQTLQVIHQIL